MRPVRCKHVCRKLEKKGGKRQNIKRETRNPDQQRREEKVITEPLLPHMWAETQEERRLSKYQSVTLQNSEHKCYPNREMWRWSLCWDRITLRTVEKRGKGINATLRGHHNQNHTCSFQSVKCTKRFNVMRRSKMAQRKKERKGSVQKQQHECKRQATTMEPVFTRWFRNLQ